MLLFLGNIGFIYYVYTHTTFDDFAFITLFILIMNLDPVFLFNYYLIMVKREYNFKFSYAKIESYFVY